MSRIYTRTGDQGETSLGDGSRVAKNSPRVSLYGDIDELNSMLGMTVALLHRDTGLKDFAGVNMPAVLEEIQSRLFDLGTVLADPIKSATELSFPTKELEDLIDTMENDLEPLKNFILPGGHPASAQLHVARSTTRRVERRAVAMAATKTDPVPTAAIEWLNRLSDFLFVAARAINAASGRPDVPWIPKNSPEEG